MTSCEEYFNSDNFFFDINDQNGFFSFNNKDIKIETEIREHSDNNSEIIFSRNNINRLNDKDTHKEKEIPLSPQTEISDTKITTNSSNSFYNYSSITQSESISKSYRPISESEIITRINREKLNLNFEKFDEEGLENVKYECKIGNYDNDGIRKQYKEDYNKNILGNKTRRTVKGRKKKNEDKAQGFKDCYSNDNIIISIKSTLADSLIKFFNYKGLNLKRIDYSMFQKEFKIKKNLEFINGPVYKILSLKVSDKNILTKDRNLYNREIIKNIRNNPGHEEIKYLLNMTLHEFMDIIRHNNKELEKKDIFDYIITIEEILNNKIEKKKGNDLNKYLTKYLMLFYNYERYYDCKTARKF